MNLEVKRYLIENGLEIKQNRANKRFKVQRDGSFYFAKSISLPDSSRLERELNNWRLVKRLNKPYQYLIIPKVHVVEQINSSLGIVLTEWIEGEPFNNRWSATIDESLGGKLITNEDMNIVLKLINELKKINTQNLRLDHLISSLEGGLQKIKIVAKLALDKGLINQHTLNQLQSYTNGINKTIKGDVVLSNGDFQYRNFIETKTGKVAIIDWDNIHVSKVESERCAAYQYTLMWNNPSWQKQFIQRAINACHLRSDILHFYILLCALQQALRWSAIPNLVQPQIEIFHSVLSLQKV